MVQRGSVASGPTAGAAIDGRWVAARVVDAATTRDAATAEGDPAPATTDALGHVMKGPR
jgi:hypothetical protein